MKIRIRKNALHIKLFHIFIFEKVQYWRRFFIELIIPVVLKILMDLDNQGLRVRFIIHIPDTYIPDHIPYAYT